MNPTATRNLEQYAQIHRSGRYGEGSGGVRRSLAPWVLLAMPRSILDYGAGQSRTVFHLRAPAARIRHRYDPAIPSINEVPGANYDLVLCSDVMEHLDEAEISGVMAHIKSLGRRALMAVDTKVANTVLPNGENAHATVQAPRWWLQRMREQFPDAEIAEVTHKRVVIRSWKAGLPAKASAKMLKPILRAIGPRRATEHDFNLQNHPNLDDWHDD